MTNTCFRKPSHLKVKIGATPELAVGVILVRGASTFLEPSLEPTRCSLSVGP
jgi:hypothetical protein